jgi:hypothetical protein
MRPPDGAILPDMALDAIFSGNTRPEIAAGENDALISQRLEPGECLAALRVRRPTAM